MNKKVLVLTVFGLCLFASYFLFEGAWGKLDKTVFYFFNDRLTPGTAFLDIVAYTNKRSFDIISFLAMGLLYLYYFRRQDNQGRRTMVCLGICMLLAAVVIKQMGDVLLPISHPSPTYTFEDVNRLTKLTDIATKDAARDSFPGDHGMMLMIYAAFMARYFGGRAFAVATVYVVIFSLPRIMSGAHWFSDIYMGSLAVSAVTMGWLLLTPASDVFAAKLDRFLPAWFFPPGSRGIFR